MLNGLQLFKKEKQKNKAKKKSDNYTSIPIKIQEKEETKEDGNYIANNHESNNIDDRFWSKCPECGEYIFNKDLEENLFVCPKCNKHMRMNVRDRIEMLTDKGTFIEINKETELVDPLKFPNYNEKIKSYKEKTNESESVVTGVGRINGIRYVLCVMNPAFIKLDKNTRDFSHEMNWLE